MEQLYQENYDWANRNKNYNVNRIHFLLDEFGNFPQWPGLSTKLSAALGYNFAFTLVLQNMEQLTDVYGEQTAGTIRANSSNFAYIKTSSQNTAEQISKWLGDRTITFSTPGSDQTDSDSRSKSMKEQPLLSPVQLMRFRPSQMLFFRAAKNDDLKGHQVDTNPIYNYGWTAMPFAFNLLKGYINDSPELARIQVDSPQRYLNLDHYAIDFYGLLDKLYDSVNPNYAILKKNYEDKQQKQLENFSDKKKTFLTVAEMENVNLVNALSKEMSEMLADEIIKAKGNDGNPDLDLMIATKSLADSGNYPFASDVGRMEELRSVLGNLNFNALKRLKTNFKQTSTK
jgi:hypothetical protein